MIADVVDRLRELARPNMGWLALAAALALTLVGVVAIGTIEPEKAADQAWQWLPLSLVVMLLLVLPHPRNIGLVTYPLMGLMLVVLAYLLIPGVPLVRRTFGATSWIDLPIGRIQPSELAKVVFVLALARYLRYRDSYRTLVGLLVPFVIMFVPVAMILKQPDLGTALVYGPALFAMLVAAGAKLRHLFSLLGLGATAVAAVVAICLWAPDSLQVLKPHQRARIVSMISLAQGDTRLTQSSAYQQDKAMTLIGAGGFAGRGQEESLILIRYNRVPHIHNDMIYTVIVNRWGLLGGWGLLALYMLLVGSMVGVAARSKDPFARLACVGFAAAILTQVAINIGMHVGVLPITGITLPLVSYGGSSLLATFGMVGLTINFATRRPALLTRPSFEFDHGDAIFQ